MISIAPAAPARDSLRLQPKNPEDPVWYAWVSFAHLFAVAVSKVMAIRPTEIEVDAYRLPGGAFGIYLADALENGSGFALEIYRNRFADIMSYITTELSAIFRSAKHERCDSSCYDCLRDYGNVAVHGLLDWRLGLELAEILSDLPRTSLSDSYLDRVRGALLLAQGKIDGKQHRSHNKEPLQISSPFEYGGGLSAQEIIRAPETVVQLARR